MARKFQINEQNGYFEIDPAHLGVGLEAAKANKQAAVRITALDYRIDKLGFDAAALARHKWIRRLSLDEDLEPANFDSLQALTGLTELATAQWSKLDYSHFKKLKVLTIDRGIALAGIETLPALRSLSLIDWREPTLPSAVSGIAATELLISASLKLLNITPVLKIPQLARLGLTKLSRLEVPTKVQLDSLLFLHVEDVPKWTDFNNLRSKSLRELELFTKAASLGFIARLPSLRKLYFWDIKDGRMEPVLEHPSLQSVHFAPHKRHYSHKEAELNAGLRPRKKKGQEA